MKSSIVVTFFNEAENIISFLESVERQSVLPDEVVLVDGGSTDATVEKINQFIKVRKSKITYQIVVKTGNRSVGRNEAIRRAKNEIIACSDVGCTLDSNWLENITEPFKDKDVDVVAGYYDAKADTNFQKSLTPYVLIMPDEVNPDTFLPATRSMAFRKSIWKKIGGFDESLSNNEDYVFARMLKNSGATMVFAGDAIVHWMPRRNFRESYTMFWRFALGDAEAGILRPKVLFIFLRYFFGFYLIGLTLLYRSIIPLILLGLSIVAYIAWSIFKNYRYVKNASAISYLPSLQLMSDAAVLSGTLRGGISKAFLAMKSVIPRNKGSLALLASYSALILSVISWGLPHVDHPFTYHMDEWHQFSSVRSVAATGNPNVPGAAYGTMFQFLLSGVYLLPFIALKIVNPFILHSSFADFEMQRHIFEILRLNTLIFGALSGALIAVIAKKYLKSPQLPTLAFFLFTPIFISLSNYFKYDIALLFWIIAGVTAMFWYASNKSLYGFFLAVLCFGLAVSTKISALPVLPILWIGYLLFTPRKRWRISTLFIATAVFFLVILMFGVPNLIFAKGDYREFLYSNLVSAPQETGNILLGMPYGLYLIFKQLPVLFGYPLVVVFFVSCVYLVYVFIQDLRKRSLIHARELFIFLSGILFTASLVPLKIAGTGNRALVLLPFIVLISSIFIEAMRKRYGKNPAVIGILIALISLQTVQALCWVSLKWYPDPREVSSGWMMNAIPQGTVIGIENIPIYQYLPDLSLKGYYAQEQKQPTNFRYEVIDAATSRLPSIVIVSNADIAARYIKNSPKKELVTRLKNNGYQQVASFDPQSFFGNIFFSRRDFYVANIGPIAPIPEISIFKK